MLDYLILAIVGIVVLKLLWKSTKFILNAIITIVILLVLACFFGLI